MEHVFRVMERFPLFFRERSAEKDQQTERQTLLWELQAVSEKIRTVRSRFDMVSDAELVDSCIYELESLNARYRFLLRKARQLQLRHSPFTPIPNQLLPMEHSD